jgi:hypothetical protein
MTSVFYANPPISVPTQSPSQYKPDDLCLFTLKVVFVCPVFNFSKFTPPLTSAHNKWISTVRGMVLSPWLRLRLALFINFPLCGNHVEWRSFSCLCCRFQVVVFFFRFVAWSWDHEWDLWLAMSTNSRYVGTMLNGTVSLICDFELVTSPP